MGALTVVGVILLWIAFRGCDPTPKSSTEVVDSLSRELANNEKYFLKHQKEDLEYSDRLEKRIDSLHGELERSKRDVVITSHELESILYSRGVAVRDKDTVRIVQNCDSLAKVAIEQNEQFKYYIETSDSIYYAELKNRAVKDSLINEQAKMYAQFRSAFYQVSNDYNKLSDNYNKMLKKRNFNKTLSRGLAIAVVVLGGILLTK